MIKYGTLAIMVANFLYGYRYVADHIRPNGIMILYCVTNQFVLTAIVWLCHQWELELEQAHIVAQKKVEIARKRAE